MKIAKDHVVRFHYSVAEAGQESIESSKDREPLAILFGHGNIIPGLEKAMEGREAGERFAADVPAVEAYGEVRADNPASCRAFLRAGFQEGPLPRPAVRCFVQKALSDL